MYTYTIYICLCVYTHLYFSYDRKCTQPSLPRKYINSIGPHAYTHIHIHIHAHMHTYTHTPYTHTHIYTFTHTDTQTHITFHYITFCIALHNIKHTIPYHTIPFHTIPYIHIYIYTYIHRYTHTYICTYKSCHKLSCLMLFGSVWMNYAELQTVRVAQRWCCVMS